MTSSESRAMSGAATMLLVASLVRVGVTKVRGEPLLPPDSAGVREALLEASDSAGAEAARRSRPLAEGERIDPNRAPEAELDRLPGVGPSTARLIVEHREGKGGFARAEDLLAVRGIGAATLEKMRPRLDLSSGVPRHLARGPPGGSAGTGGGAAVSSASPAGRAGPTTGRPLTSPPLRSGTPPRTRPGRGPPPVDLNRAGPAELERISGIGPALARRILEVRARKGGRFRSVDELLEVRGIGPATLERIRGAVRVGGGF